MSKTVQQAVSELTDWPNLHRIANEIINGTPYINGIVQSEETDGSPWNHNAYFEVRNNEIVAIGWELGREGGWWWFAPKSDGNKKYSIEVSHIITITVEGDYDDESAKQRAISLANNGLRKVGPDRIETKIVNKG